MITGLKSSVALTGLPSNCPASNPATCRSGRARRLVFCPSRLGRLVLPILILAFGVSVCGNVSVCGANEFDAPFTIDSQFPGGNIKVDSIAKADSGSGHAERQPDYRVSVRPDLRDTMGDWFYYAFRVNGAQGLTVQFQFDHNDRVGARGPAISSDGGRTWRFLSDKPGFDSKVFVYSFGENETSVFFATSILYTQKNWESFVEPYKNRPDFQLETLCVDQKGRAAELLRIGAGTEKKFGVCLTARHHCCEMIASFVMEGMIAEAAGDSETGKWLRENVEFFVVPFIDKSGVEDGDQGKNRKPHDHNRDYAQKIYPTIQSLTSQMPTAFAGKKIFFLDIHCPWIRHGQYNEQLYFPGPESPQMSVALKEYALILEKFQASGAIPYKESFNLPYGQSWNTAANYTRKPGEPVLLNSKAWAATVPGTIFAATAEVPYANATGAEVNETTARELGRNMTKAMAEFLKSK